MSNPAGLGPAQRKKLIRQHRDLRRVLRAILGATDEPDAHEGRRFSMLVSLTVRLQNMLDRHLAFEEQVLGAHLTTEDPQALMGLASAHRRQRTELSVLAKLAFHNVAQAGVPQAFRALIDDLLIDMDVEERDLLRGVRGRLIRKSPQTQS
jgi:hemerythrin HHE cation binding domain-containing protein